MNQLKDSVVVAAGLLVALASCSSSFYLEYYKVPTGRVVDAEEQPVAGALVAFKWEERTATGWSGGRVCRHARTLTTDASGSYVMPTYHGYYPSSIVPYKQGARMVSRPNSERGLPLDHLAPSDKTGDERVDEIWHSFMGVSCNFMEYEDAPSMKVWWQAIVDELRQLPPTLKRDEVLNYAARHLSLYK